MSQYENIALQIHAKYPLLPLKLIVRKLEKFNGDTKIVYQKVEKKNEKIKETIQNFKLDEKEVLLLAEQFSNLRINKILKVIKEKNGNITEIKQVLAQAKSERSQSKGKKEGRHHHGDHHHHGGRHHKREELEEKYQIAGIVAEVKKLFPDAPEKVVQRKVNHLCHKLAQKPTCENKQKKQGDKVIINEYDVEFISEKFPEFEKKKIERMLKRFDNNPEIVIQRIEKKIKNNSEFDISEVNTIVVDGNNLLYVNDQVRRVTLKKGIKAGTLVLSNWINQVNSKTQKNVIVVYDEALPKGEFKNIKLEVARPKYATSDDLIAELSKGLTEEEKLKTIFVTSDVGLQKRIQQNNCLKVVRAGPFVKYCEKQFEVEKLTKKNRQ